MPEYEAIEYTRHAIERMAERNISRADVEMTLRFGQGRPSWAGKWIYELMTPGRGGIRVVVAENGGNARVITVVRLRKHT